MLLLVNRSVQADNYTALTQTETLFYSTVDIEMLKEYTERKC